MTDALRVLLINYEYPPLGGGGGNATRHLGRALVRLGAKAMVITAAYGNLPATEDDGGLVVRRIKTWRRHRDRCSIAEMIAFMLAARTSVSTLSKTFQPDVTLAYFTLPCGPVAHYLKKLMGVPYLISLQGGDVPGFMSDQLGLYHNFCGGWIRRLWTDAAGVIANSEGLARLARAHAPDLPVGVIPAGADIDGIFPPDYPLDENVPLRLLFVGRLVQQKGLDVLLAAISKMKKINGVHLTLAGDGPLRKELVAQVQNSALKGRVTFKGWVDKNQLVAVYKEADVFVLPSRDEGMPNAMLEAMAGGLAIVGTSISGIEELVVDGITGLIIPQEDAHSLARALDTLTNNRVMARDMGRAGRARAEEHYSWSIVGRAYLDVLTRAAAKFEP